ncbi:hypothetical protein CCACVL1_18039 [Corchorus capsularis]|uniref:Uncharacterized protein n=1 Tax=Corchorus capsularis TaxID=210143 RepID=A0A1R3HN87_COCAP|nr:hypothetical protein CCACVL1_18039 [Corchorus capsularis]
MSKLKINSKTVLQVAMSFEHMRCNQDSRRKERQDNAQSEQ